jgi:outer membrane protein TolC
MLPQFTLTGTFGDQSLTAGKLLAPGSQAWNLTTALTQPLFEGGTLNARRRAAVDAYDGANARYRLVVLNAFQTVADVLTALDHDAAAFKADADSLAAAKASLDFVQRQYDDGAVDFTPLLAAQQTYQTARITYVRAQASRYTDTVSLFQALGGGWWNRDDPGVQHAALPSPANQQ